MRWPVVPAGRVDAGIAVVVFAATVPPGVVREGGARALWSVGLALLVSVPLLWRRRAPVAVALVTGVATIVESVTGLDPDLPYGPLVATYSLAAHSAPLWRTLGAVGTAAGITFSLLASGEELVSFWYNGTLFTTAYALGAGARVRRERIALLEARNLSDRAAAASAERARIARDMHDVLAHSVGLMVVQAEGGAAMVRIDPDRSEAALDAIAATGRETLVQLRHALGVLNDGSGPREPVPRLEQIPRLVERSRVVGLDVAYVERGTPRRTSPDVSVAAYRVVQEAVTNAIKHGDARRVEVCLHWRGHVLDVRVHDDGTGPPAAGTHAGGYGLAGMAARVNDCGGVFDAGPGPGRRGFRVSATLPVRVEGDPA